MGIPQLWEAVRDFAPSEMTLEGLAIEAVRNSSRGLRVGVDAEIWIKSCQAAMGMVPDPGANAVIRTIWFKILKLWNAGCLVFILFDGREKPNLKRGNLIRGNSSGRKVIKDLIELLDIMGIPHRIARGEAEAELASMQKRSHIDLVLSDDSDLFIFGAPLLMTIKKYGPPTQADLLKREKARIKGSQSNSLNSSPEKASTAGTASSRSQAKIERIYEKIEVEENMRIDQDGLLFIALASGGDYSKGIEHMGTIIAWGLARMGFGSSLRAGYDQYHENPVRWNQFYSGWKEKVCDALKNNPSNELGSKKHSLAASFTQDTTFPDFSVMELYINPKVNHHPEPNWRMELDLPAMARYCGEVFELPKSQTIQLMRSSLWHGLLIQAIRKSKLDIQAGASEEQLRINKSRVRGMLVEITKVKSENRSKLYRLRLSETFFKSELEPLLVEPPANSRTLATQNLNPSQLNGTFDEDEVNEETGTKPKAYRSDANTNDMLHWIPEEFLEGCDDGRRLIEEFKEKITKKKLDAERVLENRELRVLEKARKAEEKIIKDAEKKSRKSQESPVKKKSQTARAANQSPLPFKKSVLVTSRFNEDGDEIESSDTELKFSSSPVKKPRKVSPSPPPVPKAKAPRKKATRIATPPLPKLALELSSSPPLVVQSGATVPKRLPTRSATPPLYRKALEFSSASTIRPDRPSNRSISAASADSVTQHFPSTKEGRYSPPLKNPSKDLKKGEGKDLKRVYLEVDSSGDEVVKPIVKKRSTSLEKKEKLKGKEKEKVEMIIISDSD